MKRALQVFSKLNKGGAESRVMDLYRSLDRTQFQFDFVVTSPGEHFYMEEIRRMGGEIIRIKPKSETGMIGWFRQWHTILPKEKYIAVHSHTTFDSGLIAFAAWRCGVKKRISHARDMIAATTLLGRCRQHFMRVLIRTFSTDLIACSTEAGNFLFGKRTMKKRGILLPNAIDLSTMQTPAQCGQEILESLQLQKAGPVLGTVGNLREVKNQRFMIEILSALLRTKPDAVLLIAGEGEQRQALVKQAEELGIADHVYLLGQRNDIPQLLQAYDIFLLTSFTEGLPGSVVEAQSVNLPCVLSDTITRDVDVASGLLMYLPLGDPGMWAEKITQVLGQPLPEQANTLRLLRDGGFDVHDSLEKLLSIYQRSAE